LSIPFMTFYWLPTTFELFGFPIILTMRDMTETHRVH
jgi:hypothetical protein